MIIALKIFIGVAVFAFSAVFGMFTQDEVNGKKVNSAPKIITALLAILGMILLDFI